MHTSSRRNDLWCRKVFRLIDRQGTGWVTWDQVERYNEDYHNGLYGGHWHVSPMKSRRSSGGFQRQDSQEVMVTVDPGGDSEVKESRMGGLLKRRGHLKNVVDEF